MLVALHLLAVTAEVRPVLDRPPFDAGGADFPVRVRGQEIRYRVFAVPVMPGEEVLIEASPPGVACARLEVDGVEVAPDQDGSLSDADGDHDLDRDRPARWRWRWQAPHQPGLRIGRVSLPALDLPALRDGVRLNFLVLVPAARMDASGSLDGYPIGAYPPPRPGRAIDAAPQGFIQVTPVLEGVAVSPHFRLGQFLCHQQSGYPKYVLIGERLLNKLELLLEAANQAGLRSDGFAVLSGYRTPDYNRDIGDVPYSRHLWGDAADVFIDEDRDGRMDDLDGDGMAGMGDADRLLAVFEAAPARSTALRALEGGLGPYAPTAVRGAFVHVDARGSRARWRG